MRIAATHSFIRGEVIPAGHLIISLGSYIMASSGIRVGAWDYLKWTHISPITRDGKLLAARIDVYSGEDDEYIGFITSEAYLSLESWMKYRSACGEHVTKDSWVMRDLNHDNLEADLYVCITIMRD
jgi:hypothetical protein